MPCSRTALPSSGLCWGHTLVLMEMMMCIKAMWFNVNKHTHCCVCVWCRWLWRIITLINFTFGCWRWMNVYPDGKRASSQHLLSARRALHRRRLEEDEERKCWVWLFLRWSVRHNCCHVSLVTRATPLSPTLCRWRRTLGLSVHCREGRRTQRLHRGCFSTSRNQSITNEEKKKHWWRFVSEMLDSILCWRRL